MLLGAKQELGRCGDGTTVGCEVVEMEHMKSNILRIPIMRFDVNDMDTGKPLKDTADLKIEDFVPTAAEKDYIFQSLVFYHSHRLVERYPLAFKSIINPTNIKLNWFDMRREKE